MCSTDEIQSSLRQLTNYDIIKPLIEEDLEEEAVTAALESEASAQTVVLLASWFGRSDLLYHLLEIGVNPNSADNCGR